MSLEGLEWLEETPKPTKEELELLEAEYSELEKKEEIENKKLNEIPVRKLLLAMLNQDQKSIDKIKEKIDKIK